jgi:hypothetical protein
MKKHGRACGEREGVFFWRVQEGREKERQKKKKKNVLFSQGIAHF